jgi:hypothetical protein
MKLDANHPYLKAISFKDGIPVLEDDHTTNGLFMSYVKIQTDRLDFLDDDGNNHTSYYFNVDGVYIFAGEGKNGAKEIITNTFEEADPNEGTELFENFNHFFSSNN